VCQCLMLSNFSPRQFPPSSGSGNYSLNHFIARCVALDHNDLDFCQEFDVFGCCVGVLAPQGIACGATPLRYGLHASKDATCCVIVTIGPRWC
jgi:hypothetical protein